MAQPLGCDMCDSEPAALMVTVVDTGDTFTVGAGCLAGWAMGMVEGMTAGEQDAGGELQAASMADDGLNYECPDCLARISGDGYGPDGKHVGCPAAEPPPMVPRANGRKRPETPASARAKATEDAAPAT